MSCNSKIYFKQKYYMNIFNKNKNFIVDSTHDKYYKFIPISDKDKYKINFFIKDKMINNEILTLNIEISEDIKKIYANNKNIESNKNVLIFNNDNKEITIIFEGVAEKSYVKIKKNTLYSLIMINNDKYELDKNKDKDESKKDVKDKKDKKDKDKHNHDKDESKKDKDKDKDKDKHNHDKDESKKDKDKDKHNHDKDESKKDKDKYNHDKDESKKDKDKHNHNKDESKKDKHNPNHDKDESKKDKHNNHDKDESKKDKHNHNHDKDESKKDKHNKNESEKNEYKKDKHTKNKSDNDSFITDKSNNNSSTTNKSKKNKFNNDSSVTDKSKKHKYDFIDDSSIIDKSNNGSSSIDTTITDETIPIINMHKQNKNTTDYKMSENLTKIINSNNISEQDKKKIQHYDMYKKNSGNTNTFLSNGLKNKLNIPRKIVKTKKNTNKFDSNINTDKSNTNFHNNLINRFEYIDYIICNQQNSGNFEHNSNNFKQSKQIYGVSNYSDNFLLFNNNNNISCVEHKNENENENEYSVYEYDKFNTEINDKINNKIDVNSNAIGIKNNIIYTTNELTIIVLCNEPIGINNIDDINNIKNICNIKNINSIIFIVIHNDVDTFNNLNNLDDINEIKNNTTINLQIINNVNNNNNILNEILQIVNTDVILFLDSAQNITQTIIEKNISMLTNINAIGLFNSNYYDGKINLTNIKHIDLNGLMMTKNIYKNIKFDNYINNIFDIGIDVSFQLANMNCEIIVCNSENIENTNIQITHGQICENKSLKNSLNSNHKNYRNYKYLCYKWKIDDNFVNYDYIDEIKFDFLEKDNLSLFYNKKFVLIDEAKQIILKFIKNKKVYLVMSHWGYPSYGGGENWLIDTMTWMASNEKYASIMICFYDQTNKKYFSNLNIITENNKMYIQMPLNYFYLIRMLKLINPVCVSHQGLNRMLYLELSNILNIPFITGFCFWQNIVTHNKCVNIDMLNNNLTKCDEFNIICEKSEYVYSSSTFVNDIIYKYHNTKLDVIDTISDVQHYKINEFKNQQYVTIINIHKLKGGWMLLNLLTNLNLDIPLLLVLTEPCEEFDSKIKMFVNERNIYSTKKTILYEKKMDDVKQIYEKTKILLIGSLVDETFCKVAYEGMKNKIPILSTNCGNLKYLLDGYSDFVEQNALLWCDKINEIYNNDNYLKEMSNRMPINNINDESIKNKFVNIVENIKIKNKFELCNNNIGILCPWCDQGLGVQSREYYLELTKHNYSVHVMSFKPYVVSNNLNINNTNIVNTDKTNCNHNLFQTDVDEWNYPNVNYYKNNRDHININDILDFIGKSKIKHMIFIELCFENLFEIVLIFKAFGIKCYGIPNIETFRYGELTKHTYFDNIFCNNYMTYDLLKQCNLKNLSYLGFKINHPFFTYKNIENIRNADKTINFFVMGGLNSIIRKNIKKICDLFDTLKTYESKNKLILHVYIQGDQIPDNLNYNNDNIIINIKNLTYKEISDLYKINDIFLHMGSHEGLGLGLYEAISCGTAVLTINNCPNNEVIIEQINGWTINYTCEHLIDNNMSITKKSMFDSEHFIEKIKHIDNTFDKSQMYESIKKYNELHDCDYIKNMIKYF